MLESRADVSASSRADLLGTGTDVAMVRRSLRRSDLSHMIEDNRFAFQFNLFKPVHKVPFFPVKWVVLEMKWNESSIFLSAFIITCH